MKIANSIRSQLADIPSNRLVKLLGQALKHQVETNQINPDDDTDLFTCQVPETRKEAEECVTRVYKTIEFKKSSMVECLSWSPDGTFFAVGLVDGFVEIYNHLTGVSWSKMKRLSFFYSLVFLILYFEKNF